MLSAEEALILHDLLWRWFDPGSEMSPFSTALHPAERAVLDVVLAAQLEKQLVAPFDARYAELLAAARETVRSRYVAEDE